MNKLLQTVAIGVIGWLVLSYAPEALIRFATGWWLGGQLVKYYNRDDKEKKT